MELINDHEIQSFYCNRYETINYENDVIRGLDGSDIDKLTTSIRALSEMIDDMTNDGNFDDGQNKNLLVETLMDIRQLSLVLCDEADHCESDSNGLSTLLKGSSNQICALWNENDKLVDENNELKKKNKELENKLDGIQDLINRFENKMKLSGN